MESAWKDEVKKQIWECRFGAFIPQEYDLILQKNTGILKIYRNTIKKQIQRFFYEEYFGISGSHCIGAAG